MQVYSYVLICLKQCMYNDALFSYMICGRNSHYLDVLSMDIVLG